MKNYIFRQCNPGHLMLLISILAACTSVFSTNVWAQSFGAIDPKTVGRNYQSLDQVYAIAPAIIAGEYKMSRAQYAFIEPSIRVRTNGITTAPLNSRIFDKGVTPIIEPIDETNWTWIGATSAVIVAGIVSYLYHLKQE